jgi:hypothetical protein
MRNLDNHRYIGEAIQLLQAKGEKVEVPLWFKVLDACLAAVIYSTILSILIWLLKKTIF